MLERETETESAQKWTPPLRCQYSAPYICYKAEKNDGWHLSQGCCNHWDCERCGKIRAREEYARIVSGAEQLREKQHKLYFWTVTCQGKEISRASAEENYLHWTDRLMTASRNRAARANEYWCYVQVTERQKRGHPHSHILTTYCPDDVISYVKGDMLPNFRRARHDCLWSNWYRTANVRAGLGQECDISAVRSAPAVARYIGKYMFKATALDTWPPRWKRVRYSRNWPKLPEFENSEGFPVITFRDWFRVYELNQPVRADSIYTYAAAQARNIQNVIEPKW